ncbi:MAG: thiamine pyrophosphate-binding protein [Desulfobacterales bacterium]|nr:thiamine pyrophosphate-binding protein [Desulfobacterales bacterium]
MDTLFGFPGGAVIDIYDELARTDIRHILVRHEQGAVHAADGYARASGKVGVCLVTSGPGATNTVTGIASAYADSIPIVVHHRSGADPPHRQRRLPGGGHRRHHPPLHQAQLPRRSRRPTSPAPSRRRSTSPARAGPGPCWWTSPKTSPTARIDYRPRARSACARTRPTYRAARRSSCATVARAAPRPPSAR